MVHFRSKSDILHWLEKHCPRKAIVRSLNNAELLGGFDLIPPTTRPGWIVRVTSIFNEKRKWIVAVIPRKDIPTCEIRILKYVPWENWLGCKIGMPPIILGDSPGFYCILYGLLKEKSR